MFLCFARVAAAVFCWGMLLGVAAAAEPIAFAPPIAFGELPNGYRLGACSATAIDSQGRIYLFHRGEHPILCFDCEGRLLRSFGDKEIRSAHGMRVDAADNLWVTDVSGHRVLKFSPQGEVLLSLGTGRPGASDDQFNKPTDIAFGSDGAVFVSDGYGNSRVLVFSPHGAIVGKWGERGAKPQQFHLPHSLLIDAEGRLLVGDRENNRIQVYTTTGEFVEIWPGFAPYGLALDPEGNVFVADGRANQVLQLDRRGRVVQRIGRRGEQLGEFQMPHMLAFDADGNLFVAEVNGRRLQKFPRADR